MGITPAALRLLENSGYNKKARDGITRAHIQSRSKTTTNLLESEEPLPRENFARIWIENDKTVLCVNGENTDPLSDYILFEDTEHGLFPSKQIGWRHGKMEKEYLMRVATKKGLFG